MGNETGEDPRLTIRVPPGLMIKLKADVEARGIKWEDRTDIVIFALSEYYINRSPEKRKAEIIEAFQENPDALKGLVRQIIHELVEKKPSL